MDTKMFFVSWGKAMEQPINRSEKSTYSPHVQNFSKLICILPPSIALRYFTVFYHLLFAIYFSITFSCDIDYLHIIL